MRTCFLLAALLSVLAIGTVSSAESLYKDMRGHAATPLTGAVWVGVPVSLDAVKGNVVVLAFWNGDAPC